MTLDEAIEHAEDKASKLFGSCSTEHEQLAIWLRELRDLRNYRIAISTEDKKELLEVHPSLLDSDLLTGIELQEVIRENLRLSEVHLNNGLRK